MEAPNYVLWQLKGNDKIKNKVFSYLIVLGLSSGAGCTDQQLDAWEDFFEELEKM